MRTEHLVVDGSPTPQELTDSLQASHPDSVEPHEHWGVVDEQLATIGGGLGSLGVNAERLTHGLADWEKELLSRVEPEPAESAAQPQMTADDTLIEWVREHVRYDEDVSHLVYIGELPSDDMRLLVAATVFDDFDLFSIDQMRPVITAILGAPLPQEFAEALARKRYGIDYIAESIDDFGERGVHFAKPTVDVIIQSGGGGRLLAHPELMDPSLSAQYVVDQLIQCGRQRDITDNLLTIPSEVRVPRDVILAAIENGGTAAVLESFRIGKLEYLKLDRGLADALCLASPFLTRDVYELGLLTQMTRDEYLWYYRESIGVNVLLGKPNLVGWLGTEVQVREFIQQYVSQTGRVPTGLSSETPQYIQKAYFDAINQGYFTSFLNAPELLKNFCNLPDSSYKLIMARYDETIIRSEHFTVEELDQLFLGSGQAIWQEYCQGLRQRVIDARMCSQQAAQGIPEANERRARQRDAELTYFHEGNYVLDPRPADAELTPEDIVDAFERNHCVKEAPRLAVQATDKSRRTDKITYLAGMYKYVGTATNRSRYSSQAQRLSEYASIRGYREALDEVEGLLGDLASDEEREAIRHLRDNITFIGKKEYKEATKAAAVYWKTLLDTDPELKIYICTQAISGDRGEVKSDEYFIDRVIAQFSDDELEKYHGRLTMNVADIRDADPRHVRVVLMDDWTISGSQLRVASRKILEQLPQLAGRIEIQLIAASRERIALGLEGIYGRVTSGAQESNISIPVRAYYVAHDADIRIGESSRGVCVTGAHSSVDFGFDETLAKLAKRVGAALLPLTNIVRPYRKIGYKKVYPLRMKVDNGHSS